MACTSRPPTSRSAPPQAAALSAGAGPPYERATTPTFRQAARLRSARRLGLSDSRRVTAHAGGWHSKSPTPQPVPASSSRTTTTTACDGLSTKPGRRERRRHRHSCDLHRTDRRCVRHVQGRETRTPADEGLEVFGRLQLRLPVVNQAAINASTASPKNRSACFGWLIVKYTMATTTNTTAAATATMVSGRIRKGTLVSGIGAP